MEDLKEYIVEMQKLLKKQQRVMQIMLICAENKNSAYHEHLSDFMLDYHQYKDKIAELEKNLGL